MRRWIASALVNWYTKGVLPVSRAVERPEWRVKVMPLSVFGSDPACSDLSGRPSVPIARSRWLLLLLCLPGCGTTIVLHRYLEPKLVSPQPVQVRSEIPLDRVAVPVTARTASFFSGGLLRALEQMDKNAEARAREKRLQPFHEDIQRALDDFDFRREFWSALTAEFQASPWLRLDGPVAQFSAAAKGTLDRGTDKAQCVLETDYRLSQDGAFVAVHTLARYFPPNATEPAYFGHFVYLSAPVAGDTDEATLATWAADGGAALRRELTAAVRESMRMLRLDLSGTPAWPVPPPPKRPMSVTLPDPWALVVRTYTGNTLDESGDRVLMRHDNGNLISLSRKLDGHVARPAPRKPSRDDR